MSEEVTRPGAGSSEWTFDNVMAQTRAMVEKIYDERHRQEKRWGPQDRPMVDHGADGHKEVGRPYRQWESIMRYLCDQRFAAGHGSMDVVFLEEVFEAMAALVALEDAKPCDPDDLGQQATYIAAKEHAVTELIQAAAVAAKMAGQIERNY